MQYPFRQAPDIRRSFWDRFLTWSETRKLNRRENRRRLTVEIQPLRAVEPLASEALPLICLTRNDVMLLPGFFRHYRNLGVSRFIFLDDGSTDGTREYLLDQADADIWTSPIRYRDARRGRLWREALFAEYGLDRWYLNVDSDEFLIYDRCEQQPISSLIAVLQANGFSRMPAPMIDMYPAAEGKPSSGDMPWEFSSHFDGLGYDVNYSKRSITLTGGPRGRRFDEQNELMKYPLIYWDKACSLGISIHQPLPYDRNFSHLWGVLLHFKFYANYREKIVEAVEGGQHFNGAAHYKRMRLELDQTGEINLTSDSSIKFIGADQLIDLGFMPIIPFEAAKAGIGETTAKELWRPKI
jgi:hypothetical protein